MAVMDKPPEERFDSEHDARILARAHEVRGHKGRFRAAQEHVKKLHAAVMAGAGEGSDSEEGSKRRGRKRGGRRGAGR